MDRSDKERYPRMSSVKSKCHEQRTVGKMFVRGRVVGKKVGLGRGEEAMVAMKAGLHPEGE